MKAWPSVRKISETLLLEIENGLLDPTVSTSVSEFEVRRDYAITLEQAEEIEQAREKLAWAFSPLMSWADLGIAITLNG